MGLTVKDSTGQIIQEVETLTFLGATVIDEGRGVDYGVQVDSTSSQTSAAASATAAASSATAAASSATAAASSATAAAASVASIAPKIGSIALAAVDTGGGIFSWQNPEPGSIFIIDVVVNVTTPASSACSIDVGATAASGTTKVDNLIDGLDVHTAAGAFDQSYQAGANGKTTQVLAAGKWVTGSMDSGASAGIVGKAYIVYGLV